MLLVENLSAHPKKRNFTQHCQFHHIQPSQTFFDQLQFRSKLKPYVEGPENNLKIIMKNEKSIVEKEYRKINQYLGEVYLQNKVLQDQRKKEKNSGSGLLNSQYENDMNASLIEEMKGDNCRPNQVIMDIEENQFNESNYSNKYDIHSNQFVKNSSFIINERESNKYEEEIANNVYEYYRQEKEQLMKAIESRQNKMFIEQ